MKKLATIILWSALLTLGLLLAIPAAIVASITGVDIDAIANAMSGWEV